MRLDSIHLIGGEQRSLVIPNSASTDIGSVQIGAEGKLLKVLHQSGRYQNIALDGDVVYDFVSHTFTAAGKRGAYGPSLNELLEEYQLAHWLEPGVNFNAVDGIQEWTVPETAVYRIEAQGAFGQDRTPGGGGYGRPAVVSVDAALQANDVLKILVGQCGIHDSFTTGGASFVESRGAGLLVAAGGSGGPWNYVKSADAKTDINTPQTSTSGSGLVYLNQYKGTYGAGYSADALPLADIIPAKSFLSGGDGAYALASRQGGFGGGGVSSVSSGYRICGGGGGYSGGSHRYGQSGEGGTSWCVSGASFANRSAILANFAGQLNGYVTITKL